MYLIFPESMIIPEVADRREDDNFEDWLTAALIENTNQQHLNGIDASAGAITDVWMLEIAERTGKVWRGRFHVEFNKEDDELPENDSYAGAGNRSAFFFPGHEYRRNEILPEAGSGESERERFD
jgi:hypothetical protein